MGNYLIGIDVGGTNIKMMIMDDTLQTVEKDAIRTEGRIGMTGYEEAAAEMICKLESMFQKHEIQEPKVMAVGMGLPGMVDARNRRTLNLPYLRWDGMNPAKRIEEHFQTESVIENDGNVNVIGEYYFGDASAPNMILLTLGTGVGAGIICNGEIFGGSLNYGGEAGHMVIAADEGASFCGRNGCLEAYCSGSAMEMNAKKMMQAHPETVLHRFVKEHGGRYDNAMVTEGYLMGDSVCMELFRKFDHYLAVGITNLIELFNPELILLGGGVSNAGDIILEPVREEVSRRVLCREQICRIQRATLGAEAGMYGACALAARKAGLPLRADIR